MIRSLFASLALVFASGAAVAQDLSRIKDPAAQPRRSVGRSEQAAEAQRVMNDFGACIVKTTGPTAVKAVLARFPGSEGESPAMMKLASPNCLLAGELRFLPMIFRGSLYEALYESEFRVKPVDVKAAPKVDYYAGAADRQALATLEQVALREFADCIVRGDQATSRALILTRVGHRNEAASFDTLMPAAGKCLLEGEELTLSRPILRGLVAEALYRLSRSAAPTQSAAK